ncbi:MAG: hypothetical protein FJY77_03745 [Candidatus Altiarchaeales archaeon]|nr:hypothetical protein [Candidatus Altiarchaeales archaeon]
MHYIKEVFLRKPIDHMHGMFTRYGRGAFEGPTLTVNNGPVIKVDGSIHYANILGEVIVESSLQEYSVSGAIHAKRDIKVPLKAGRQAVKAGLHSVEVEDTIHSDGLKMVYNDFKDAYILLSLTASSGKWKLSCKKKPPKPGGKVDEKFFNATLEPSGLAKLMEEILFDVKDKNFKQIEIKHEIIIDELVGTPELKKDAAKFRLEAKRKGKIKRILTVDGKTTETIKEFSA